MSEEGHVKDVNHHGEGSELKAKQDLVKAEQITLRLPSVP